MRTVVLGVGLTLPAASIAVGAQSNRVRVQLGYATSMSDLVGSNDTVGIAGNIGPSFSYERLLTRRLGLEASVATSKHRYTLAIFDGEPRTLDLRLTPVSLVANFHFEGSGSVDVIGGAGLTYVAVGETMLDGRELQAAYSDGETTWTAHFGADIRAGRAWGMTLDVSYRDIAAHVGTLSLPIETLTFSAGVHVRF